MPQGVLFSYWKASTLRKIMFYGTNNLSFTKWTNIHLMLLMQIFVNILHGRLTFNIKQPSVWKQLSGLLVLNLSSPTMVNLLSSTLPKKLQDNSKLILQRKLMPAWLSLRIYKTPSTKLYLYIGNFLLIGCNWKWNWHIVKDGASYFALQKEIKQEI